MGRYRASIGWRLRTPTPTPTPTLTLTLPLTLTLTPTLSVSRWRLRNAQRDSIEALWRRSCAPADDEARMKLPPRCDLIRVRARVR